MYFLTWFTIHMGLLVSVPIPISLTWEACVQEADEANGEAAPGTWYGCTQTGPTPTGRYQEGRP